MPRDAVSRTANVERNGGHKWVKALDPFDMQIDLHLFLSAKTKIGSNRSRALFRPIAVSSYISK